jgi:hypothetical protein
VKKVDLNSVSALTAALRGQDAVVSVTSVFAIDGQYPIVDAAVAAGVKRFIPSEFGMNTRTAVKPLLSIVESKVRALDYIIEKAAANPSFTWTGISTGLIFDWVSSVVLHFTFYA